METRSPSSPSKKEIEFFETVPDEILVMFIQTLNSQELAALARTNKRWNDIVQNLIEPQHKKEIEDLLHQHYIQHAPKTRSLSKVTPKMMSEIGLMNTSTPLVRESIRKGYVLNAKDLFSLYDYIKDSNYSQKVKLVEELLKSVDMDESYLTFLFEKIWKEKNQNNKEKSENLLRMADLLIQKGICITNKDFPNQFKVRSNLNKELSNKILDKINRSLC
jgi:hypothetical protein